MTDWIKHVPGDPMPVEGDTLVSCRLKNNQETSIRPAAGFDWGDDGGGYNITAYRIHKPEQQKEREMKYKAGTITLNISQSDADILNRGNSIIACGSQIIAHEPAPEPIVGYVYYADGHLVPFVDVLKCGSQTPKIRIIFNPATKEVKAEVVE